MRLAIPAVTTMIKIKRECGRSSTVLGQLFPRLGENAGPFTSAEPKVQEIVTLERLEEAISGKAGKLGRLLRLLSSIPFDRAIAQSGHLGLIPDR